MSANNEQDSRSLALAGIRVVEWGQGVAAAFATKLLALLGAEVVKVEPPDGDIARRRGPFFNDVATRDGENCRSPLARVGGSRPNSAPGDEQETDVRDPNLSGLFLYLNADKSGVTLDLHDAGDRGRLDD